MAATWAYEDCETPLTLSGKWATNNKLLQELVEEEEEKKVKAKEEELRAQAKELMKVRAEVTQLEEELVRSCDSVAEVPTLKAQLEAAQDQARTATVWRSPSFWPWRKRPRSRAPAMMRATTRVCRISHTPW